MHCAQAHISDPFYLPLPLLILLWTCIPPSSHLKTVPVPMHSQVQHATTHHEIWKYCQSTGRAYARTPEDRIVQQGDSADAASLKQRWADMPVSESLRSLVPGLLRVCIRMSWISSSLGSALPRFRQHTDLSEVCWGYDALLKCRLPMPASIEAVTAGIIAQQGSLSGLPSLP